jgi:hypothetical protein
VPKIQILTTEELLFLQVTKLMKEGKDLPEEIGASVDLHCQTLEIHKGGPCNKKSRQRPRTKSEKLADFP